MNDSKAKILSAASELFADAGASGLSVRAISKRAGLSTIGIYNHFSGKQGILDALYIKGFELVTASVDVADLGLPPREAVLQGLSNYIDFAASHRPHYELIFGSSDPSYTPSSAATLVGEAAFNALSQLVSAAIPADLNGYQKREAALQLWALAHGYVSLQDHEATDLIPNAAWRDLTMKAVSLHLDALIEKFSD